MKHFTLFTLISLLSYTAHTQAINNDCSGSSSQIDLNINNVRARILGGGSMWWDLSNGRYIVPNVAPGEKEVSSIFAAGLWIGGYDAANNLKLAAQTYRQNGNDFWQDLSTNKSKRTFLPVWLGIGIGASTYQKSKHISLIFKTMDK